MRGGVAGCRLQVAVKADQEDLENEDDTTDERADVHTYFNN